MAGKQPRIVIVAAAGSVADDQRDGLALVEILRRRRGRERDAPEREQDSEHHPCHCDLQRVIPAERSERRDPTLGTCMLGDLGPGSALRAVRDDSLWSIT